MKDLSLTLGTLTIMHPYNKTNVITIKGVNTINIYPVFNYYAKIIPIKNI